MFKKEQTKTTDGLDAKFEVEKASDKSVSNDVPTCAGDANYQIKVGDNAGDSLKQEKVAQVLGASTVGSSAPGMNLAFGGGVVSGTESSTLVGRQGTPQGTDTRKQSRFDKKIERVATKLNYTPSEQFIRATFESKPLSEAKDEVQGYNGNYINDTYKVQKANGATPADLTYERSVDIIEKDMMYFSEGQLFTNDYAKYPSSTYDPKTKTYVPATTSARKNYVNTELHIKFGKSGDLSALYFAEKDVTPVYDDTIAEKTNANALVFDNTIELEREALESKAGNETLANWTPLARAIKDPNAVLSLLHDVESTTGAEVFAAERKLKTALAFQLNRATKDGIDLQTPGIEAMIGNIMNFREMQAYKEAFNNVHDVIVDKSLDKIGSAGAMIALYDSPSKYSNKADLLLQPRSFKMHLGTALANDNPLYVNPTFVKAFLKNECFSTEDGVYDPTLPVFMTDKCNIIHPHSFNALGGLKRGISFAKEFKAADTISVSDIKTFCGTDDITAPDYDSVVANGGFLYKHNPEKPLAVKHYIHIKGIDETVSDNSFVEFKDDHNKVIAVGIVCLSTVNGIAKNHGYIVEIDDKATKTGYYSKQFDEEVDVLMCIPTFKAAAVANVDYVCGDTIRYAYTDQHNVYISEVRHPFMEGLKDYFASMRGKFLQVYGANEEVVIPVVHSTRAISMYDLIVCAATPFIVNARVKYLRDLIKASQENGYLFTDLVNFKDVKDAAFENFTCADSEQPLGLGKLNDVQLLAWNMPEMFWTIYDGEDDEEQSRIVLPWYMNEEDYVVDANDKLTNSRDGAAVSWPSIRAGMKLDCLTRFIGQNERKIRLSMDIITGVAKQLGNPTCVGFYKYGLTTAGQPVIAIDNDDLTIAKIIAMPRQLGWAIEVPNGACTPKVRTDSSSGYATVNLDATAVLKYSHRAYMYMNVDAEPDHELLEANSISIYRGANFAQKWVKYTAAKGEEASVSDDYGVTLGAGRCYAKGELIDDYTTMTPVSNTDNSSATSDAYVSLASDFRYLHDRIQIIPTLLTPFDAVSTGTGVESGFDIFNMAYIFGLCGFRASDYSEDVYNRNVKIIKDGLMYTKDIWLADSYLG